MVMLWDPTFWVAKQKHTWALDGSFVSHHQNTEPCSVVLVTDAELSYKCWQLHCRPLKSGIEIYHQRLNLKPKRCGPASVYP